MAEKKKKTPDEIREDRIKRLQKANEDRKLKKQSTAKDNIPADEPPAQEPPADQIGGTIKSDDLKLPNPAPDKIMPVPEMSDISSLSVEPVIEAHVDTGAGNTGGGSTTPPLNPDLQQASAIPPEGLDIGEEKIYGEPPPPPGQGAPAGNPLDDPNMQGGQQGQSAGFTKTQAEQTFENLVLGINNMVHQFVKPMIDIKAPASINTADEEFRNRIMTMINSVNADHIKLVQLSPEEVDQLRGPAVAVLQESSIMLSNKQLLAITVIQIGISKVVVCVRISKENKKIVAVIKDEIDMAVNHMRAYSQAASDDLRKANERVAEADRKEKAAAEKLRKADAFESKMRQQHGDNWETAVANLTAFTIKNAHTSEDLKKKDEDLVTLATD